MIRLNELNKKNAKGLYCNIRLTKANINVKPTVFFESYEEAKAECDRLGQMSSNLYGDKFITVKIMSYGELAYFSE